MLHDPDIVRFTRVPENAPPGFAREWLGRYQEGRRDGSREAFAVLDADARLVGLALAPRIDRAAREAELGYLVAPSARGRGVATELLCLLTDWAFEEAGVLRAELVIDVDNPASQRVAERAGYLREGVLRSIDFKDGLRIDAELWSRLPTDPTPPPPA